MTVREIAAGEVEEMSTLAVGLWLVIYRPKGLELFWGLGLPKWLRLVIVLDHARLLALKIDHAGRGLEIGGYALGVGLCRVLAREDVVYRIHLLSHSY